MKHRKTSALLAFLLFCFFGATAQQEPKAPVNLPNYNKPRLFSDLPDQMPLQTMDVEKLLDLPVGAQVSTPITKGFNLVGKVVSKSDPQDTSVKTVVIKSVTRQGAVFTLTRTTFEGGKAVYSGRMLNLSNGDALEIVKEGNQYMIRKKGLYDLINE